VSEDALPALGGGFRLLAEIEIGAAASGIICALGDWSNGWALYLLDGRPVLAFNILGRLFRFAATAPIAAGRRALVVELQWAGRASTVAVAVDGTVVAQGELTRRLPFRWQIGGAGLLVGRDRGFPVCDDYQPPFPFSGVIKRLVIEAPSLAPPDAVQEIAAALHRE